MNNTGIVVAAGRKGQVSQLQLKYHNQQERAGVGASATERVGAGLASNRDEQSQKLYSGCKIPGSQNQSQRPSHKLANAGNALKLAQNVQLKFQKPKTLIGQEMMDEHKNVEPMKTQRDQKLNKNM